MSKASSQNLKAYLKNQLKLQGLSYKDLAKKLKVSEITVKRWMTSRDMKSENIFKIQDVLQVKALQFNLNELAPSEKINFTTYTLEQERHFVDHPRDLLLFIKLQIGLKPAQVKTLLRYSEKELLTALARLEKIKALEVWPGEKIRLTLKGPFMPLKEGPLVKKVFSAFRDHIMSHFRRTFPALSPLHDPGVVSQFRAFEFYATEETAKEFSDELRNVVAKYYRLGVLESQRKEKVHPYSVLIGVDQYDVLSEIAK